MTKKVTTENDKLNKVIGLFLEIKKLFPKNSCNLNIHEVDIKSIDRKTWKIEAAFNQETLKTYLTAANTFGDDCFGIDLYDKE